MLSEGQTVRFIGTSRHVRENARDVDWTVQFSVGNTPFGVIWRLTRSADPVPLYAYENELEAANG